MSIINPHSSDDDLLKLDHIDNSNNSITKINSDVNKIKYDRGNSGTSADFFANGNNNTDDLISENGEIIRINVSANQSNIRDKIIKIITSLHKTYNLNKKMRENLLKRYEELTNKQDIIENTLEKIKRINKNKQKKHVKYLRYIPLNKIYFYSPKRNHFYYILMDIVVKSRKKFFFPLSIVKDDLNDLNNFNDLKTENKNKNSKKKSKNLLELVNKSTLKRSLNRYKFKEDEDEILKKLLLYSGGEYIDWYKISKDFNDFISNFLKMSDKFKSRTALECYTRSLEISDFYNYKKWTNNEDLILKKAILYYGPKNWQQISYCLEGRNNSQAFHRWMKGINPKIKRNKWSFKEDLTLGIALRIYGNKKWSKIANHLAGRTDIQCRERFCNILDPSLEEVEWKPHEDAKLLMLYDQMKNKWSKIAKEFGNRTDNTCWRRWKYLESIRKGMGIGFNYNITNRINSLNNTNSNIISIDSASDCTYGGSNCANTKIMSKKNTKKKEIFKICKEVKII